MLSGLAGALSVRGLQLTGGHGRDPFLFTIEVSVFSAATLLANIWLTSNTKTRHADTKKDDDADNTPTIVPEAPE